MTTIIKKDILDKITTFHLPSYQDIPDIGLFLDQTNKYINEYLITIPDAPLTNSMISNYVKKKIIANPIKKCYYRDQIAYLFFIAIAKTVLSLEDIQVLLTLQKENYDLETAYQYFTEEFNHMLLYVYGKKEAPSAINEDASEIKVLFRNMVITAAHKAYLSNCFTAIKEDRVE